MVFNLERIGQECHAIDSSEMHQFMRMSDPELNRVAAGLTALGYPTVESLLRNVEFKWTSFIAPTPVFIISVILCVILVYQILATILASIGLCFPLWAWKIGPLFCYKRNAKSKRIYVFWTSRFYREAIPLTIFYFIAIAIMAICMIFGYIYGASAIQTLSNFRCHSSLLQAEFSKGIMHQLGHTNLDWIRAPPEQMTYGGLDKLDRMMVDFRILNLTTELYAASLSYFVRIYDKSMKDLVQYLQPIMEKPIKDKTDYRYDCIANGLRDASDADLVYETIKKMSQITTDVFPYFKEERIKFVTAMNNLEATYQNIVQVLNGFRNSVESYLNMVPDPIYSLNAYYIACFILVSITTIISVIIYLKVLKHVQSKVIPTAYTYARFLGTLWVLFSLVIISMLIAIIILFNVTTLSQGLCSFVRSLPKNPDILSKYEATRQFINDKTRERLFDRCIANSNANSSFQNVLVSNFHSYLDHVDEASVTIMDEGIYKVLNLKHVEVYDVMTLIMEFPTAIILNSTDQHIMFSPNHYLVEENFFTSIYSNKASTSRLNQNFQIPVSMRPGLDVRMGHMRKYQNELSEEDRNKNCAMLKSVSPMTITHISDLMIDIENKIESCAAPAPPVKFCITVNTETICTDPTNLSTKSIEINKDLIISDVSDIFSGDYSHFKANEVLEPILQACKQKLEANPRPTCELLQLNSIYVGLRLLGQIASESYDCKIDFVPGIKKPNVNGLLADMYLDYTNSVPIIASGRFMFKGQLSPKFLPLSTEANKMNCGILAYDIAEYVEHACGPPTQPLTILFICMTCLWILSFIGWVLSYRGYLHFLNAQMLLKRARPISDAENPASWLSLIRGHKGDKDALYELMEDSPINFSDVKNDMESGILHYAAYVGDKDAVGLLLEKGVPVDTPNARGYTPLGVAVSEGHAPLVEYFIRKGANPAIRDEFGDTPLHAAARAGDINCVKALCHPTAPAPTYHNNEQEFAVDVAERQGYTTVSTFLGPLTPRNTSD